MSSVFGLIMATAGCPWTDRLRPMARFHVPFAGEAETLYRSVSMYLLSRELVPRDKRAADRRRIRGARGALRNLHVVNRDMSRRLGAAASTDPARNAMALLDSFTRCCPLRSSARSRSCKPLFDGWQTK